LNSVNNLNFLEYMLSESCKFDSAKACFDAAYSGHLQMLQWVPGQGHPWDDTSAGWGAATEGNLEILLWMSGELHITSEPDDLNEMLVRASESSEHPLFILRAVTQLHTEANQLVYKAAHFRPPSVV
jgi:hypothetical protein